MATTIGVEGKDLTRAAQESSSPHSGSNQLPVESAIEGDEHENPEASKVELTQRQTQTAQSYESDLLLEIQRQLAARDPLIRAKDLQLQELEDRIFTIEHSASYRLGRLLTWPFRIVGSLFNGK